MLAAMRRASSLGSKLTADRLQALGIEVLSRGFGLRSKSASLANFAAMCSASSLVGTSSSCAVRGCSG